MAWCEENDPPDKSHESGAEDKPEEEKGESQKQFESSLKSLVDDAQAGKDRNDGNFDDLVTSFRNLNESEQQAVRESMEKLLQEMKSPERLANENPQTKFLREWLDSNMEFFGGTQPKQTQANATPTPSQTPSSGRTQPSETTPPSSQEIRRQQAIERIAAARREMARRQAVEKIAELKRQERMNAAAATMAELRARARLGADKVPSAQVADNRNGDPNIATFRADTENVEENLSRQQKLDLAAKALNEFGLEATWAVEEVVQAVSKPAEEMHVDLKRLGLTDQQIADLKDALGIPRNQPIDVEVGQLLAQVARNPETRNQVFGLSTESKLDGGMTALERGVPKITATAQLHADKNDEPTSGVVTGDRDLEIQGQGRIKSFEAASDQRFNTFDRVLGSGEKTKIGATEQFYVTPTGKLVAAAWDGEGDPLQGGIVPHEVANGDRWGSEQRIITTANCTMCHDPDAAQGGFLLSSMHNLGEFSKKLDQLVKGPTARWDLLTQTRQRVNANISWSRTNSWATEWRIRNRRVAPRGGRGTRFSSSPPAKQMTSTDTGARWASND